MKGRRFYVVVGVILSAVCLWIAFRRIALADLSANLRMADYRWLICYPVLATALNLVRSEIWRLLLRRRVTRADAFWAYVTGFLVNNVLPFRMGEVARISLLAARRHLPLVEVASAAALERVLDLVSVMAIIVATLPFAVGAVELRHATLALSVTAAVGTTVLALVIVLGDRVEPVLGRVLAVVLPRHGDVVLRRWRELTAALSVARDPAIAIRAIVGAVIVWTITIVLHWTILRAFQPAATLLQASLLVGIVSIAGAVPAAPGGIGTYQWVAQQALVLPFPAAYTPASALAVAIVTHAATYVYGSVLGALGLWYFGVPLTKIAQSGHPPDTDLPYEVAGRVPRS